MPNSAKKSRKLLVVRHGKAEDRQEFQKLSLPDSERPLTREGKKEMWKAARGLSKQIKKIDFVFSSDLVRARETALVLSEEFGPSTPIEVLKELRPGSDFAALLKKINQFNFECVALVGHEPDLSSFVGWLLTGTSCSIVQMKKGSMALIEFEDSIVLGEGCLRWLLTSSHLGKL